MVYVCAVAPNRTAIRELRIAKKITYRELAARAGLSHSHLANIEAGRRGATAETLQLIADGLGVQLDSITLGEAP